MCSPTTFVYKMEIDERLPLMAIKQFDSQQTNFKLIQVDGFHVSRNIQPYNYWIKSQTGV